MRFTRHGLFPFQSFFWAFFFFVKLIRKRCAMFFSGSRATHIRRSGTTAPAGRYPGFSTWGPSVALSAPLGKKPERSVFSSKSSLSPCPALPRTHSTVAHPQGGMAISTKGERIDETPSTVRLSVKKGPSTYQYYLPVGIGSRPFNLIDQISQPETLNPPSFRRSI